jgi:hypothetical protein
LPRIKEQVE